MTENRVVQGRMVTPGKLAEMIEGGTVMEVDSIADADRACPDCGSDVLEVVYMPSVTELVTGLKCQDCDWSADDRE
jgi:DNA-directed RNA polymerase subunit RPC12/RpoP